MANVNRPFGFKPVKKLDGSAWTGAVHTYVVLGADTSDYYIGDLVMPGGSADAHGIPSAIKYIAGGNGDTAPLGAIVGVLPVAPITTSREGTPLSLEDKRLTGSITTDRYILVVDDVDVVYEVQADSTGLSRNSVGSNVDVTVAAPGNANQRSATVLLGTSDADTETLPFRILGYVMDEANEISSAAATDTPFVRTLVRPNEHATKLGTIGLVV